MPLPTRSDPVQWTASCGLIPAASSASAFIGLTVEPGGYSPCVTLFINGTWSFCDSMFHSRWLMPSEKLLGS